MSQITTLDPRQEASLRHAAFGLPTAGLVETRDQITGVLNDAALGRYEFDEDALGHLRAALTVVQHELNARVGGTITDLRGL
jgi:hypothetical protein